MDQSLGDIFKVAEHYGRSIGTIREAEEALSGKGLLTEIKAGEPTRVIARPAEATEVDLVVTRLRGARREVDEIIRELEKVNLR